SVYSARLSSLSFLIPLAPSISVRTDPFSDLRGPDRLSSYPSSPPAISRQSPRVWPVTGAPSTLSPVMRAPSSQFGVICPHGSTKAFHLPSHSSFRASSKAVSAQKGTTLRSDPNPISPSFSRWNSGNDRKRAYTKSHITRARTTPCKTKAHQVTHE